jgi:hypothetical protein
MTALPATVVRLPAARAPGDVESPVTLRALPRTVNLVTYRGDDFAFALTVWNDDETPADLSSATLRAQVRAVADADEILGTVTVTVDANAVDLHLTAATSADLPRAAVWDVEMVDAGWTTTLAAGSLVTTADVTR